MRLLLVGVAVVLASESVGQAQVRLSDENVRQILEDRVVREKKGVAIVAGLLDDAGERVIAFGPPIKGSDLTVGGDSLFEIGSITKTFVTTLLAEMYQAGKSPALGEGLELTESYYLTVTRDGTRLFVQPGELRKVEVFAETDRDFFWLPQDARDTLLLRDAQATFVRDGSGIVSHMVLHSNGSHWPARKLR